MKMNTSNIGGGLINLGGNLEQPRDSNPSDYSAVGPSGPAGQAEGAGKLITLTQNQEGPRHINDDGENTPSVWGKFDGITPEKNKGEGAGQSNIKCDWSVDFETGQTIPNASQDY